MQVKLQELCTNNNPLLTELNAVNRHHTWPVTRVIVVEDTIENLDDKELYDNNFSQL
jgi:hypothetical protein